jgi:hypothetical protein
VGSLTAGQREGDEPAGCTVARRRRALGQTEIGPAGVDVRSDGTNLRVVAYEQAAAVRGDPVSGAVLRIGADGSVISSIAPTKRLFANGVVAVDGELWLLDSVAGLLLRLPA